MNFSLHFELEMTLLYLKTISLRFIMVAKHENSVLIKVAYMYIFITTKQNLITKSLCYWFKPSLFYNLFFLWHFSTLWNWRFFHRKILTWYPLTLFCLGSARANFKFILLKRHSSNYDQTVWRFLKIICWCVNCLITWLNVSMATKFWQVVLPKHEIFAFYEEFLPKSLQVLHPCIFFDFSDISEKKMKSKLADPRGRIFGLYDVIIVTWLSLKEILLDASHTI